MRTSRAAMLNDNGAYGRFARFYDNLTANVDYKALAAYCAELIARYTRRPVEIVLDLCCGTGSLAAELAALGFDMIGADASPEMLGVAAAKEYAARPLFLCQRAESLDLYGTVDACVCALDSLNHLPDEKALSEAISSVSLFLAPGGVFVFDLNTLYKHRELLAENAFVYDTDAVFCVWRNRYRPEDGGVDITLDFFEPDGGGGYRRETEEFTERLVTRQELLDALEKAGLELLCEFAEDSFEPPDDETGRVVYVAGKPIPEKGCTDAVQQES